MNEKVIIDWITSLDVKTIVILGFITIRLFPDIRQYVPDLWEVAAGRKKLSDIRIKTSELKHFEKKQTFVASEKISETDCDAFYLRLIKKINQAANNNESITFSFVKVRKISRGGLKGLRQMINAVSLRDDCIVKLIFPKETDTEVLKEIHQYALDRAKDGNNMLEIKEDQRGNGDHDSEE